MRIVSATVSLRGGALNFLTLLGAECFVPFFVRLELMLRHARLHPAQGLRKGASTQPQAGQSVERYTYAHIHTALTKATNKETDHN